MREHVTKILIKGKLCEVFEDTFTHDIHTRQRF